MFGLGKEKDFVATITPDINTADTQKVIKFPDYLQQRFSNLQVLTEEYDLLLGIRRTKSLPNMQKDVYDNRINELKGELIGLHKLAQAIHLGYEPFTVSEKYYLGGIEDTAGGWRFNSPLPPTIIDKYREAKKAKVFDRIVVASPNQNHFLKLSTMRIDPLMVGFVKEDDRFPVRLSFRSGEAGEYSDEYSDWKGQEEGNPGVKVDNGIGFLIAHWDLSNDLKALTP